MGRKARRILQNLSDEEEENTKLTPSQEEKFVCYSVGKNTKLFS